MTAQIISLAEYRARRQTGRDKWMKAYFVNKEKKRGTAETAPVQCVGTHSVISDKQSG